MSLNEDLQADVKQIFNIAFKTRKGQKVPEPDDIQLGNDAVNIEGTVLYADMDSSTALVDGYKDWFAAKVYKAYLRCAAKIIRAEGGVITSYDGDRIMAVFIGDSKNSTAARVGLKINYATAKIVSPAITKKYPKSKYTEVKQVVGIDTCELFVARTGIRGSNDLVWVGHAANYAAKLTELSSATPTWITKAVYDRLVDKSKYSKGEDMWQRKRWTQMDDQIVYCSSYWWKV